MPEFIGEPRNLVGDTRHATRRVEIETRANHDKPSFCQPVTIGHLVNVGTLVAEFMYKLRYDKQAQFGMEPLWQQANHLLTSCKSYATEPCNFNFVFSDYDAKLSQWGQVYSFLPFFLYHAVQIVEALMKTFAQRAHEDTDTIPLRTDIGMLLWMQDGPWKARTLNLENQIKGMFNDADLDCQFCGRKLMATKEDFEKFYDSGDILCAICGK